MANDGRSSIVDLNEISKPVTKLVEVVSNAVGAIYLPTHTRRMARAEADASLIKIDAEIEVQQLRERAAKRLTQVETRRQSNIESITEKAFDALPKDADSISPDPDWVSEFFNLCQDISDEQLQIIWSRLLAREVSSPGQYSIRTLQLLKTLTNREAVLFGIYCSSLIDFLGGKERIHARVIGANGNKYLSGVLGAMDVVHLCEIGLISHKTLRTFATNGRPQEYKTVEYFGKTLNLEPLSKWYNPISWYAYLLLSQSFEMEFLTKLGAELYQVAQPQSDIRVLEAAYADLYSIGVNLR